MDIKIRPDSSEHTKPRRPVPNYFSASVRLRLATLIALLGLALVAMHEAGKPETWERLGFGPQLPDVDHDTDKTAIEDHLAGAAEKIASAYDQFWSDQFRQLNLSEKQLLFRLMRPVRNQFKPSSGFQDDVNLLIQKLKRNFDALESSDEEYFYPDQEKQFLVDCDILHEAAKSNEKIIARSPGDVAVLQNRFDKLAYDMIEDRSSMSRSSESIAWIRSWDRLAASNESTAHEAVTYIQLAGQPHAYRGKFVRLHGEARGLESIATANKEIGMDAYNVLWIKPNGSGSTPYCVYVRELPTGFPEPTNRFQTINELLSVNGIFFKLRSYVANNEQIETCPLIVADTIEWQPRQLKEAEAAWAPPIWLLTLFFVGMPIIAALLAIGVYRSTTVSRFVHGTNAQREIDESLVAMTGDSTIKSDQERVRELYEPNLPDG